MNRSPWLDASDEDGLPEVLWEDGERRFYRIWRSGADGARHAYMAVLPAAEPPTPGSISRLAHEYALKEYIDSPWALRPLELVRERGQTVLVLDCHDGEPLDRQKLEVWPSLPLDSWRETYATLHMWAQIAGEIRLKLSPMRNHWWHVPLYVTAHGLSTSLISYRSGAFQIDFDLVDDQLRIGTTWDSTRKIWLGHRPVAHFYQELLGTLHALGVDVKIWTHPVEVEDPIPFELDDIHGAYDPESAQRFWNILVQVERVFQKFRSGFLGKCSPVHFFWGSFDLGITRFSGRPAPPHPGGIPNLADWVAREAYSHEVSSCGFWPGGGANPEPAFYAYAYPEPQDFAQYTIQPDGAFYHESMREFILPFEVVRQSANPDGTLMAFLQSTYDAAAERGGWDRGALEREPMSGGSV